MRFNFKTSSSAIAHVAYDSETKQMGIAFTSNPKKFYDFYAVPAKEVAGLVKAPSIGRYYHANIRGKYASE